MLFHSFCCANFHFLAYCCLVDLIDVTLAYEDANSNLLMLLLLLMLMLGHVDDNWCNLGHIAIFFLDFEVEFQAII